MPRTIAWMSARCVEIEVQGPGLYQHFRPGGMTVHGGSVILEPGLTYDDFAYLLEQGVWLAKGGFGAVRSPLDYVPLVRDARRAGIVVNVHTGGGSIPGTLERMDAESLLQINPDVSFHANGGPTAMLPGDNERLVRESDMALQLVMAGNLRSSLDLCRLAREHRQEHRILVQQLGQSVTQVAGTQLLR